MNFVAMTGRLTNEPKIMYGGATNTAIAKYNLAVSRDGKDKGADFVNCVAFGKTAELIEKYCGKGQMVAVVGSISTGSYEKDGRKIYTTEVLTNRIEFLSKSEKKEEDTQDIPMGFTHADDIPF